MEPYKPAGLMTAYRTDYAVCPCFNALNTLITCTLKAGQSIIVGQTQSADC